MKKYFYIPTGHKVWMDLAIDLRDRGIAEPVLWLGDDRHYLKAKKYFGEAVLYKQEFVFYPERLKNINYSGENADFFLSENYLRAKDRCLKMMDRLDLYGTFSRLDRDIIFNKLTITLLKKIDQSKPDALVMSEMPHAHTFYLIYEICLYMKIEIIKFNTWLTLPLIYIHNLTTGEIQNKGQFTSNLSQKMREDISNYVYSFSSKDSINTYELPGMKLQRLNVTWKNMVINFFRSGLLALVKEYWFQTRMYFNQFYYPINPYKIGVFGRSRNKRLRRKNLIKAFNKTYETINLDSKYIYFALHYEPERTTNPDGGEFHDQAIAIAKLRELVPDNIDIFVKEHPTQLFYLTERGARGRSPLFYDYISNINGVKLVPKETNSLELIKKSIFVSSIAGSACVEAAIMGKQSLIFGDTWCNGLPNMNLWNSKLSFDNIITKELATSDEILKFLLSAEELTSVPGFINLAGRTRFSSYVNENFDREEFKGKLHLLEEFFSKL